MTRYRLCGGLLAALALAATTSTSTAQELPARLPRIADARPASNGSDNSNGNGNAAAYASQQAGYVKLDAPLNPTPVPYVPHQVGGTMITNQAFYPHEMLYPHTYRALYPPYYHRVKGRWYITPFGVREHQHWELLGTQVEVKYHSHISPFALFHPPK